MEGFVKLWRQLMEHDVWRSKPFSPGQVWVDMLMRASYRESKIPHPAKVGSAKLRPGEFICSLRELSVYYGWSRNRLKRTLQWFKNESMVETSDESSYTRVKILNWSRFQVRSDEIGPTVGPTIRPRGEPKVEPLSEPPTDPLSDPIQEYKEEERRERREERGADAPLPPPLSASPLSDISGKTLNPYPLEKSSEDDLARSLVGCFGFCSVPSTETKERYLIDLLRQGVTEAQIRATAVDPKNQDRPFLKIYDAMVAKKKSNRPTSSKHAAATSDTTTGSEDRRCKDELRKAIDNRLASMPERDRLAIISEAEETASKRKIPPFGREIFVQTEIRRLVEERSKLKGEPKEA